MPLTFVISDGAAYAWAGGPISTSGTVAVAVAFCVNPLLGMLFPRWSRGDRRRALPPPRVTAPSKIPSRAR
ncbi:hypothetical protein ABGB12_21425 [Actinocorallia sp. B10E7]|uniref:hypothetical protein n=1 Tax=Actinocorallia sp. B10E7 TaxID=3153558 RepID=UPI00325E194A